MDTKISQIIANMNEVEIMDTHHGIAKVTRLIIGKAVDLKIIQSKPQINKDLTYFEFKNKISRTVAILFHSFFCILFSSTIFSFSKLFFFTTVIIYVGIIFVAYKILRVLPLFRHFLIEFKKIIQQEIEKIS